jgi:hypothetical protein
MRLKWAIVGCMMLAGSAACAETSKPRNILEFLFGTRKAETPAAISPSAPGGSVGAKAAAKAAKQQAIDGSEPKRSIRKGKTGIDSEKRSASAGGVFRGGGSHAYCVRTCDGFFFPISHEGAHGNDRYASACQQSCPGAETQVYFMKRGGDIKWASNARGASYSSLENALKYRKERDPACSCKSQAQKWGPILAAVEPGIRHHKGDLVVTEEISQRIAQGEDAMAIAKAAEQQGTKQAEAPTGKRAETAAPDHTATTTIRSSFGDKITPANKFIKIDPGTTGSIDTTAKPKQAPAPAGGDDGKPAKPEAKAGKATDKSASKTADKQAASPKTPAKAAAKTADKAGAPKTVLAAAKKAATQPAPAKESVDRLALRQTLERLGPANKRQ